MRGFRSDAAISMNRTLPFLLLLLALPVSADIYKCRQPDGTTKISNSPCSGGAATLKTMPDDVVPEANRLQAERDADRLEEYADKLEAKRKADEAIERKEREKQQAAATAAAAAAAKAAAAQPTPQPVPYYYAVPVPVRPQRPVAPLPEPVNPPATKPGKPANVYNAPKGYYQAR